jgi:hypothetical protein
VVSYDARSQKEDHDHVDPGTITVNIGLGGTVGGTELVFTSYEVRSTDNIVEKFSKQADQYECEIGATASECGCERGVRSDSPKPMCSSCYTSSFWKPKQSCTLDYVLMYNFI